MTSGIVLGDALRSNLLSLSNTNSLIDQTQLRLATGLEVNSALDDPQNFFAAASLNNRASDLSGLLDSIGQSVRVIEEANIGITSLTTLLDTADSITTQATEALSAADESSSITSNATTSLTGVTDLTTLSGINDGDTFTVQVGNADSTTFTINTGDGISSLLADLNDVANLTASIDSSGQLSLATTNGESLTVANGFNLSTGAASTALTSVSGLGFTGVETGAQNAFIATGVTVGVGTVLDDGTNGLDIDGESIDITVIDQETGVSTTTTIALDTTGTVGALVTQLDTIEGVNAGVDDTGDLFIESTNGDTITIADNGGGTPLADLGFTAGTIVPGEAGTTVIAGNSLSTNLVNAASGGVADRTDTFAELLGFVPGANGDFETASDVVITVNGGTNVAIDLDQSISDFVDQINNNANGNTSSNLAGLTANFNDVTGELTITADSTVVDFDINTASLAADEQTAFGFSNGAIDALGGSTAAVEFVTSSGDADATLGQLASDFNEVLAQIDNLVADASFAGINLLQSDNLVSTFNEDGSSTLVTEGVDFSSGGLGISEATFTDTAAVSQAQSQIDAAVASVQGFGTTIANDLTIIQVRQDFTENTINTLIGGAEDLTVADQTEEGANLLALQTRQQLGITSLSLAAASQQAVLSLF